MPEISQVGCILYLGGLSVLDIRSKRLPIWLLILGGALAAVFQMKWKTMPVMLVLAGGAVGIVFLMVSRVTEEAFGYGDSILIGILGVYLGFWNLLSLLVITFVLAAGTAMVILVKRQFRRKSVLPFVPFLGIGYLLIIVLGGF